MAIIRVSGPNKPSPLAEKRAAESIIYSILLDEILDKGELVISIKSVSSKVVVETPRIRQGKIIELRVPPSTSANMDGNTTILFLTNLGNVRAAVFTIRIHT
jgi:hypothetical protein